MLNIMWYLRNGPRYLRNERGLEIVEWVLVGALLTAIAILVYPGALQAAMDAAMLVITNALNPPG